MFSSKQEKVNMKVLDHFGGSQFLCAYFDSQIYSQNGRQDVHI